MAYAVWKLRTIWFQHCRCVIVQTSLNFNQIEIEHGIHILNWYGMLRSLFIVNSRNSICYKGTYKILNSTNKLFERWKWKWNCIKRLHSHNYNKTIVISVTHKPTVREYIDQEIYRHTWGKWLTTTPKPARTTSHKTSNTCRGFPSLGM